MSVYLCVTRMDQLTTRYRPADAKVSARQQCVYEDPKRKWCAMLHAMVGLYHGYHMLTPRHSMAHHFRWGSSYTHCCRALTFASAGLYLVVNWSIRVTHRQTDTTRKFGYSGPWLYQTGTANKISRISPERIDITKICSICGLSMISQSW